MANRVGRPTKYKKSIAKAICLRLMIGQSLNTICSIKGYPTKPTVFGWLHKYNDFFNQYQRAREVQQESHLDQILDISDDGTNDWMERKNSEGEITGWVINGENVQRSKLRVNTRQWIMERMAPKKFGVKQSLDHTSSDGTMTPTKIERVIVDPNTANKNA